MKTCHIASIIETGFNEEAITFAGETQEEVLAAIERYAKASWEDVSSEFDPEYTYEEFREESFNVVWLNGVMAKDYHP